MAYYAASTPPPPKAPSLAPTTASELTVAPITPPVEKKKVKDLLKRALKEVSGGGGNNAKLEEALKGGPVLRPYGRGGIGTKSKVDVDVNVPHKTTSKSPSNSLHKIPSDHQYPSELQSPSSDRPRVRDETTLDQGYFPPEASGYYVGDDGESESVISSIPAPRRTQQWINHLASLPSPPSSHAGTPPVPNSYASPGSSPQHRYDTSPSSPPHASLYSQPSQYSRATSDPQHDANQAAAYRYRRDGPLRGVSNNAASFVARGLESVDERGIGSSGQHSPGFEEQFGRFGMSDSESSPRRLPSSPSFMSSSRPWTTSNTLSGRSPASQYTSRFTGNHPTGQAVDDPYVDMQPSHPSSPPFTSSSSQFSQQHELAVPQRHYALNGQPSPQSIVDQYIAAAARSSGLTTPTSLSTLNHPVALQSQPRELQSQIENLREQERKARERLEAFRRLGETRMAASGSHAGVAPQQTSPSSAEVTAQRGGILSPNMSESQRQHTLPVMSPSVGAEQRTLAPDSRRRVVSDASAMTGTTSSAPGAVIATATVVPSPAQLEVVQRERLRQQALEREREELDQPSEMGSRLPPPPADPHRLGLVQQRSAPNAPSSTVANSTLPGSTQTAVPYPGLDAQQQLIMQLGALLVQQQQQLQLLTAVHAGRAAPSLPPTSSNAVTGERLPLQHVPPVAPGVTLPALGGLDLNALLSLAALQQQQQQQQNQAQVSLPGRTQSSDYPVLQETPILMTSPPSNDHSESDPSPAREGSPVPSSHLSPSPAPSDSMSRETSSGSRRERETPVPAPNEDEKYLEAMGMNASDATHLGSPTAGFGRTRRSGPPRTGPPRAPLPALPNMRDNHSSQSIAVPTSSASGSRQGTPPPAYNRTPR